jgi:1-acyl-sn-glycerol-3-phosphate acyltransferase
MPFRSGIGLLANGLRVPIVPIGIEGTYTLLPKGRRRPGRGPVTVRFGPAVSPAGREDRVVVTTRLAAAVESLARAPA